MPDQQELKVDWQVVNFVYHFIMHYKKNLSMSTYGCLTVFINNYVKKIKINLFLFPFFS